MRRGEEGRGGRGRSEAYKIKYCRLNLSAPGGARTHNLRLRRSLLYPLSYGGDNAIILSEATFCVLQRARPDNVHVILRMGSNHSFAMSDFLLWHDLPEKDR